MTSIAIGTLLADPDNSAQVCLNPSFLCLQAMVVFFSGKSQICNPMLQNDINTIKFCQKGTVTAQTIFLVSGAPRLQAVSGCLCAVAFPRGTSNITLSYDNGYPHRDCGIKIFTENEDVLDCYSKEITVQKPFMAFQSSKTTHAADKHFCLQVTPGWFRASSSQTKGAKDTSFHIQSQGCYNQATTKLAFHSNETSKDKLQII